MDKNYGGVIWTNHALSRLRERGISQGDAWATFNRPDFSRYAKSQNAYVYYKIYNDEKIEVKKVIPIFESYPKMGTIPKQILEQYYSNDIRLQESINSNTNNCQNSNC